MTPPAFDDPIDTFRAEALKLRSVLLDRTTGLPSYTMLVDDLRGLLERRRRLGVLHVEIADPDLVESLYGWQVLDRILSRASRCLQEEVGEALPSGTLLGINGAGGDRFVAFLPAADGGDRFDPAYLERLAEGIRQTLDAAFDGDDFAGLSPPLRFRTGHALLSEDPFHRFERRVHSVVEEARTMQTRRESRREASREAELRRIIEDAAVDTLFQPVVDLKTGAVLGFEALSRGPKDSVFELPAALFALSRRFGLEPALDRLCRRKALLSLRGLPGGGKVFLNVLPQSLTDPEWSAGQVASLLEEASLPRRDLVVEVSERSADADPEGFAAGCDLARRAGFSLALDGVGTGYGTLSTLESVRPDYLKMDASLVSSVHENLIKQDLLTSLVQISRRMGAEVIALGVESADEAAVLLAMGARYGQGFHFARPGPVPGSERAAPPADVV